ncbi:MAG: hypothetical protein VCF24_24345 [Candidatus Latescibacterota bacterium]
MGSIPTRLTTPIFTALTDIRRSWHRAHFEAQRTSTLKALVFDEGRLQTTPVHGHRLHVDGA